MNQHTTLLDGYRAALDWWREAGVDLDIVDEPVEWLRVSETGEEVAPPAPPAKSPEPNALERALSAATASGPIGGDRASWPTDIAQFREWWLREPSLDDSRVAERAPPRGVAGADVMVLVGQPDDGDRQVLLSGEQGRVLDAFARAAGLDENRIYVASVLTRSTPLPDWSALADRGLGAVLARHIQLAAPGRLLAFGRALAPLLGVQAEATRYEQLPLLIAPSLESIDRSPARKKRFWKQWLDWTA